MDLPFSIDKEITIDDIPLIKEYNLGSDVESTKQFYKFTIPKIELRDSFKQRFNLDCLNYSDAKIGSELMLKKYCEKTQKDPYYVKKLRTYRDRVALKDILVTNYQFKDKGFQQLYLYLYNKTVKGTDEIEEKVFFRGVEVKYGSGGFHGCTNAGVYEEDDKWMILDIDAGSLYPFYSVLNKNYPEHLGPVFSEIYKETTEERIAAKIAKDMVTSDGLKLALNACTGNYNSEYSFLYDLKAFLSTTINCQLQLTQLSEDIAYNTPCKLLQMNTDGITVMLKRDKLDDFKKICKQWEAKTGYTLEDAPYKKMVIKDVNNYIAVKHDGKTKEKGCFEVDKKVGSELAFHKNHSKRIVRLALRDYYSKNVPVEKTITEHEDIRDFLIHSRTKRGDRHEWDDVKQQKTLRYYISTDGLPLFKIMSPNKNKKGALDRFREKVANQLDIFSIIEDKPEYSERRNRLSAGYLATIMNKLTKASNINYQFYIDEANKIVRKCGSLNLEESKEEHIYL